MEWDQDAQDAAVQQARSMSSRDPEAASLLIAHVVAAQELQEQRGSVAAHVPINYDPRKLYDYMCKEYGWTVRECDETHYMTFFALVHEANERHRKEADEAKGK